MTQARWTDAIRVATILRDVPGGEIAGLAMLATANHEAGEPEIAIAHVPSRDLRLDPDLGSEWVGGEPFLAAAQGARPL